MKYIPLSSLQNPYPSITNYRKEGNSVTIQGFYEENSLNIPTLDFEFLGVISNTSFRFIIRTEGLGNNRIITSDSYYNELQRAKNSSNPYFINTALNPDTFVKINLAQLKNVFEEQGRKERPEGVTVRFNVLFFPDGSVNYQKFGEYIDWVVSIPNISELISKGVLPSPQISQFDINPNLPSLPAFPTPPEVTVTPGGGSTESGTGGSSTGGSSSGGSTESGTGGSSVGGSTGGGSVGGEGEQGNPIPGNEGEGENPRNETQEL